MVTFTEGTLYTATSVLTSTNLRALVSSMSMTGVAESEIAADHALIIIKTSTPATTTEGKHWYDSTNDVTRYYNGSGWYSVGIDKGATLSGTPVPTATIARDAFWDTTTKVLSLNDGVDWFNVIDGHIVADAAKWGVIADGAAADQRERLQSCIYAISKWVSTGAHGWTSTGATVTEGAEVTLWIRPGAYLLTKGTDAGIQIPKGIKIVGASNAADAVGAVAPNDCKVKFVWSESGTQSGPMFQWFNNTQTRHLHGGGIENVYIDGQDKLTGGIQVINCQGWRARNIQIEGMKAGVPASAYGVNFHGENTLASEFCEVDGLNFRSGTAGTGANAVFISSYTGAFTRHCVLRNIRGEVEDGYMVRVNADARNHIIENVKCDSVLGTGGAIWLNSDATHGAPSGVRMTSIIDGDVLADEDTGPNFLYGLEGGKVTLDEVSAGTNDALLHYETYDRTDGDVFKTKEYIMSDKQWFPATVIQKISGSVTEDYQIGSAKWVGTLIQSSGLPIIGLIFPTPDTWATGTIENIILHVAHVSADNGTSAVFDVIVSTITETNTIDVADKTVADDITTFTSQDNSDLYDKITIDLESLAYTRGDLIGINVKRDTSHASDTSGHLILLGVEIDYKSSGPNSGSDTFDVRNPYWV